METRNCQNCKKDFTIEPDDFSFYGKIKVPPPTFCPECRAIRRMIWRNVRSLYKRQCGLCRKSLISMYPEDGGIVYCSECYNGDSWDTFANSKSIDWSQNFLSQIYDLFKLQPRVYQYRIGTVINSDYGNSVVNSKNAYLCFSVLDSEDVMYSENIDRSRNSLDCLSVQEVDQCFWNLISSKNYNCYFMISSQSCIDSSFLFDCVNCQNCCMSSNQRNQQYVFKNKKLTKDEYNEAVRNLRLETFSGFESAKENFDSIYRNAIHKYANIVASQNVTGDTIFNSKNVFKSFNVVDSSEDVKYSYRLLRSKEITDCSFILTGELAYECLSASGNTFSQVFSVFCLGSKNMQYSLFNKNCSDCFGCVGLKNSQHCILNKQYSKEEYKELVEKIKKHMNDMPYVDKNDRVYKYGEFFPCEFSPFGYNETVNLDFFPISEDEATSKNYPWKKVENKDHAITIDVSDLQDSIRQTPDSILNEVIACPNSGNQNFQCTSAFKITPNELQFYRQKDLPIPRYCPNCRHYQRMQYQNPMRLYKRECMCDRAGHLHADGACSHEFETSYAPDRPEKVYCEACYQAEVL